MKFNRLGFIGAGKMAFAMARGMVNNKIFRADQIMISDPQESALELFCRELHGVVAASNNIQIADKCDIVIVAVKPQKIDEALHDIQHAVSAKQLWISIAAGVTIGRLVNLLGTHRVARVMPNTPCLIGQGISGIAASVESLPEDIAQIKQICNSIGKSVVVTEGMMDAVTGLSGSGPAFVFAFIESLIDGGILMGLTREVATALAVQTVLGAAKLINEEPQSPAELRAMVTSPGGTTIAGLKALEDGAFRATVMNAVQAATLRSLELGK